MNPTSSTKPSSVFGSTPHAAELHYEQKSPSPTAPKETIQPRLGLTQHGESEALDKQCSRAVSAGSRYFLDRNPNTAVLLTPDRRTLLVSSVHPSPSKAPRDLLSGQAEVFIRALNSIRADEINLDRLQSDLDRLEADRVRLKAPAGFGALKNLERQFNALSLEEKNTSLLPQQINNLKEIKEKSKSQLETKRQISANYNQLEASLKTICAEHKDIPAKNSETAKQILTLIKWISEIPIAKTNKIFGEALDALLTYLPEEFPIKAQELICQDDESGEKSHIVKPAAVEILFRFFEEEYGFDKDVISCQKLSALPNLVKQMTERAEEGEIKGWAISNDEDAADPHMVPVFATFKENRLHLFISDSLGYKPNGCTSAPIEKLLAVSSTEPNSMTPIIHVATEKRQNATRGCWAFTANDLKNQYELHRSDRIDAINNVMQGEVLEGSNLIRFALPQTMMKMSQSMTLIRNYSAQDRPKNAHYLAPRRLSPSLEAKEKLFNGDGDLHSAVREHTIHNAKKAMNSYADLKRQAYILNILIQECGLKEEVLPISESFDFNSPPQIPIDETNRVT